MIRVVLFDLDGVIRHFDPQFVVDIERKHGLRVGSLDGFAFAKPLIDEVTTCRITRAEWVRQIGDRAGNARAAAEWGVQPAHLDREVLALSDEIRGLGLRTAVLTNGTDTIPAEIAELGIAARFDAIFNSADIGFVKPDTRAFQHVLDALMVAADEVYFIDDSAHKLVGAESLGMRTHLFRGVDELRDDLAAAGVAVRERTL